MEQIRNNVDTLAIDPGPVHSGWMLLQSTEPREWGYLSNDMLIQKVRGNHNLVIEDMSHFGPNIRVGRDVFETCKWMGRFEQQSGHKAIYILRQTIKTHITGMATATDANVRLALIDKYGGEREAVGGSKCKSCGGKGWNGRGRPACEDCHHWSDDEGCGYEVHPGPLFGIKSHEWSALALGLTYLETIIGKETPM
jgi:hypothetical protein